MAAFGAAPVAFKDAHFSGYASGTVVHADLLQLAPDLRLVNADEAFSGSEVNSDGLQKANNELSRPVAPANPAKNSFGRGSGVEVGLGEAPDGPETFALTGKSESIAPPSTNLDTQEISTADILPNPLVYASVLRGQSQALWSDSQCIIGQDISFGRGHAADAQLLSMTATNNDDGTLVQPVVSTDSSFNDSGRAVASSYSHEFLDVQRNAAGSPIGTAWGTVSEARMTIAPITLFKGTDMETTIEIAGEWVLRAQTGGINGSAWVKYGPEDTTSPSTPVVTVHQNGVADRILKLQDIPIIGDTGLVIPISPLIEVRIGEDPRALGNPDPESQPAIAANGTSASAAVDVVKVTLLDGALGEGTHAADIRVGHMEVAAKTPAGGIDCGIPVSKSASPRGVTVNQSFVVTIKIDNPFGCDLTAVKVVDDITTKGDARFEVISTNPAASSFTDGANLASGNITWNNIGSIPKGTSKSVTATIKAEGGGGEIDDVADVSAVLGNCEGQGNGNQLVGSSLPLRVPVVLKLKLPPTGVGTSATTYIAALSLLSLAGVAIRQIKRNTI
jgi:hypothetical protein